LYSVVYTNETHVQCKWKHVYKRFKSLFYINSDFNEAVLYLLWVMDPWQWNDSLHMYTTSTFELAIQCYNGLSKIAKKMWLHTLW